MTFSTSWWHSIRQHYFQVARTAVVNISQSFPHYKLVDYKLFTTIYIIRRNYNIETIIFVHSPLIYNDGVSLPLNLNRSTWVASSLNAFQTLKSNSSWVFPVVVMYQSPLDFSIIVVLPKTWGHGVGGGLYLWRGLDVVLYQNPTL